MSKRAEEIEIARRLYADALAHAPETAGERYAELVRLIEAAKQAREPRRTS